MSHIYASKKKGAAPAMQGKAAENISKSDMLHLSGAGAPPAYVCRTAGKV